MDIYQRKEAPLTPHEKPWKAKRDAERVYFHELGKLANTKSLGRSQDGRVEVFEHVLFLPRKGQWPKRYARLKWSEVWANLSQYLAIFEEVYTKIELEFRFYDGEGNTSFSESLFPRVDPGDEQRYKTLYHVTQKHILRQDLPTVYALVEGILWFMGQEGSHPNSTIQVHRVINAVLNREDLQAREIHHKENPLGLDNRIENHEALPQDEHGRKHHYTYSMRVHDQRRNLATLNEAADRTYDPFEDPIWISYIENDYHLEERPAPLVTQTNNPDDGETPIHLRVSKMAPQQDEEYWRNLPRDENGQLSLFRKEQLLPRPLTFGAYWSDMGWNFVDTMPSLPVTAIPSPKRNSGNQQAAA